MQSLSHYLSNIMYYSLGPTLSYKRRNKTTGAKTEASANGDQMEWRNADARSDDVTTDRAESKYNTKIISRDTRWYDNE